MIVISRDADALFQRSLSDMALETVACTESCSEKKAIELTSEFHTWE